LSIKRVVVFWSIFSKDSEGLVIWFSTCFYVIFQIFSYFYLSSPILFASKKYLLACLGAVSLIWHTIPFSLFSIFSISWFFQNCKMGIHITFFQAKGIYYFLYLINKLIVDSSVHKSLKKNCFLAFPFFSQILIKHSELYLWALTYHLQTYCINA